MKFESLPTSSTNNNQPPALEHPVEKKDTKKNNLEEVKEKNFTKLKRIGAIKSTEEPGVFVVDKDKLFNLYCHFFSRKASGIGKFTKSSSNQVNMLALFEDVPVYTTEDYQKKLEAQKEDGDRYDEIKPKTLFYKPVKLGADFNPEDIRKQDFYFTSSDFSSTSWIYLNSYFQDKYGSSAEEQELAFKIFHPRFGNGYRNKDGDLMVKVSNKEHYKKINAEWIQRQIGSKDTNKPMSRWSNGLAALASPEYKNLRESGVLKPTDLRVIEGYTTSDKFRKEARIGRKGTMFIEKALYNLGVPAEGKKLVKLAPGLYGIVDEINGHKILTHYFELLPDEELIKRKEVMDERVARGEVKKSRSPWGNIFVSRKEIDIKKYKRSNLSKKREDEKSEDYADRVPVAVENYDLLQQLSHDLAEKAGIGIHNLPLREQAWLAEYAYSLKENYDNIIKLSQKNGLEGLRCFLACEYGQDVGDKIVEFGLRTKKEIAQKVFHKYSEVIDQSDNIIDFIKNNFDDSGEMDLDLLIKVKTNLLKKAKDILLYFIDNFSKDKNGLALLEELESVKTELVLLAGTFRALSKKEKISLADVKNFSLDIIYVDSLSDKQKVEMEQIFKNNRKDYPADLQEDSLKNLRKLMSDDGMSFHTLDYKEDLVGFLGVKNLGKGRVYANSLNVRQEAKGSAIGSAMLKAVLDEYAKENVIEAVVYEKNPMKDRYLTDFGFKIVGEIPDYHNTGQLFYKLERDDGIRVAQAKVA